MAEWYDKKLSDLSEEDKFDMLGEMKELLKEFYKTTKYGKIDDVKLIAKTILDTFAILVFNSENNDGEHKLRGEDLNKIMELLITDMGEA